jgi:uncharacterized repeat protein (TIGR01451 family)
MVSGGTITTVAGNGNCCYSGDGGKATSARLDAPSGVAVDSSGNLYIADTSGERVRVVLAGGTIATLAGIGSYGYTGDGGSAAGAMFRYPYAIALDGAGNVAVVDQSNNAVRLLTPTGAQPVLSIQSTHGGAFAQGGSDTYTVTVSNAAGAGPTNGTVTVTEMPPAGLSLVSMAGFGWNCSAAACTRSDTLNGGSSYSPITVTVNVAPAAPSQLTNQVTASGGGANMVGSGDLTIIIPASSAMPTAQQYATTQPVFGLNLAHVPVKTQGRELPVNSAPVRVNQERGLFTNARKGHLRRRTRAGCGDWSSWRASVRSVWHLWAPSWAGPRPGGRHHSECHSELVPRDPRLLWLDVFLRGT